ncbi:MAG TPA: cytochrome c biogenesis protein CcsA [Chloroflexia bacterium]|nr:cytochrome c biogenesis protein CcsA [Chloroflexia bacterium]
MASVTKNINLGRSSQVKPQGLNWANLLWWGMLVTFPLALICILIAPSDVDLKYSQRIFYFHLPANIMCFAAFTAYFVGAIGYWRTRKRKWDILMVAGLEIGVFFSLIGIVTGSIWAAYAWGTFWTWDPRLTTVTIMLVVYLAGWMLRNSIDDPNRKAALTAVFGIVGFINVPLVFFSTRFFPATLHPIIFRVGAEGKETTTGLEGFMNVALAVSFVAVTLLFIYLMLQRIRLENMRDKVAAVRVALYEDEDEDVI